MSLQNVVIGVVAVAALVLAGVAFTKEVPQLGSAAGQNHSFLEFFDGGLTYGSGCFATSTTGTLTAGMLEKNGCIRIAAAGEGQAVLSLTLPATTTMSGALPVSQGTCRDWVINAADVAAATTTTIVAGAGWNLVGLDATGAGTGADVIDGLEYAKLTACRENDGDITGYLQEYIHAD